MPYSDDGVYDTPTPDVLANRPPVPTPQPVVGPDGLITAPSVPSAPTSDANIQPDAFGGFSIGNPSGINAPVQTPGAVNVAVSPTGRDSNYGNEGNAGRAQEVNAARPAGVLTAAASQAAPDIVGGAPSDGLTDAQRNNAPYHAQYLQLQDRNRLEAATAKQDFSDQRDRQVEQGTKAAAAYEAEKIKNGTDLFRAKNHGNVALINALNGQAAAQSAIANAPSSVARRDYLKEATEIQGAVQSGVASRSQDVLGGLAQAQGAQAVAKGGLELKQQQRLDDLSGKLASAKTQEEQTLHSNAILSLLGKSPDQYTVTHSAGGTDPTDPLGVRKLSDNVVVTDKRTGQSQIVAVGSNAPKSQFTEGQLYTDAKGNKAKYVNGKFVPA